MHCNVNCSRIFGTGCRTMYELSDTRSIHVLDFLTATFSTVVDIQHGADVRHTSWSVYSH